MHESYTLIRVSSVKRKRFKCLLVKNVLAAVVYTFLELAASLIEFTNCRER